MSGSPAVYVEGLGYTYPDGHRALDDVNLTIARGQRVAVLGPNGSGKTTLALHLNGIHETQEGRVHIGDLPVAEPHLGEVRRRVGLVFQNTDDQLFMPTVREDVAFGPANLGLTTDETDRRVKQALDAVGAAELVARTSHHLSGGERKRVAVATVLAMEPDVLVLDEPTANLDPAGRRELITVLSSLSLTLVVITHDLPFAWELCERAVIVNQGRVSADGSCAELLSDAQLLHANRLELPYGFGAVQSRVGKNHGA